MQEEASYDAIVVGTGQAGKPLARRLAEAGWKTAILEREELVGGSCVVVGCTPTKTMVASARVAHLARRAADYGVMAGPVSVSLSKVRERKRAIVDLFSSGSRKALERTKGLDLIFGEASFLESHRLEVATPDGQRRRLTAPKIFINTGTRAAIPKIEGLSSVETLTSGSIMELETLPEHLLILGGGYIGVEFGQMFRRFGSRVTILHRGPQLLTREDEDLAAAILEILSDDGIEVHLETTIAKVTPGDDRAIRVQLASAQSRPGGDESDRAIEADRLLLAAGRTPNSDSLNPEAAGLAVDDRGFLPVNERLETNVEGIYVLGDANGGPAFTHISYDDYRILETNLLNGGKATTERRLVPYAVFMDPELGRVGLNEREARQKGIDYRLAKLPMTHVARALESDETRGFMKALVAKESDEILGCAVLGLFGGEVMSVVQTAMMGQLPYTAIRDGVFAHPTLSESLNNLFMKIPER